MPGGRNKSIGPVQVSSGTHSLGSKASTPGTPVAACLELLSAARESHLRLVPVKLLLEPRRESSLKILNT